MFRHLIRSLSRRLAENSESEPMGNQRNTLHSRSGEMDKTGHATQFIQLNIGWNADPCVGIPVCVADGDDLQVRFRLNCYQFPDYSEDQVGVLTFVNCSRFNPDGTNDEGWYRGQCRFSEIAPGWGEFYEVVGELHLNEMNGEWINLSKPSVSDRHFLFYFKENTLECQAHDWRFRVESDSLMPDKTEHLVWCDPPVTEHLDELNPKVNVDE